MDYHVVQKKIKEIIKEDSILYKAAYVTHRTFVRIFYGEFGVYRIIFLTKKQLRIWRKKSRLFDPLKQLQKTYAGRRCFIIATGPSLRIGDVERLNNEVTFGMNSLVKIYSKTNWRPTFYVVQDCSVWDRNKKDYFNEKSQFLIGDNVYRYDKSVNELKHRIIYPLDLHNHDCVTNKDRLNPKTPAFSTDCYKGVEDGYTVTYSVIQLAMYMGFSEIYLLGVDCDYSNAIAHVGEKSKVRNDSLIGPEAQMKSSYETAEKQTKLNHVKIYNATRGGKMDTFERIDFDNIDL